MKRECKRCGKTWLCNGDCRGACLCISCFKFYKTVSAKKKAELYNLCFPSWKGVEPEKVIFT